MDCLTLLLWTIILIMLNIMKMIKTIGKSLNQLQPWVPGAIMLSCHAIISRTVVD